jgi:hypothetical protein
MQLPDTGAVLSPTWIRCKDTVTNNSLDGLDNLSAAGRRQNMPRRCDSKVIAGNEVFAVFHQQTI